MKILAVTAILLLTACADPRFSIGPQGTTVHTHSGGRLDTVPMDMLKLYGPVRVEEGCYSACTALLVREDVCTEPDALWKFHGVQGWVTLNYKGKRPGPHDLLVANWYSSKPGMREWFLSGDLVNWRELSGLEMAQRGWVPLCS